MIAFRASILTIGLLSSCATQPVYLHHLKEAKEHSAEHLAYLRLEKAISSANNFLQTSMFAKGFPAEHAQFKLGMASSERRDQICEDIPNVLFEELFGSQNVGFLEETDSFWIDIDQRLLSDLDLSLFQLEYEVVENNKTKRYRTTLKKDNIYTQPSESFIEIG